MRRLAFVLTLALAAPLWADPPKVPEPVKANVGDDIQIEVTVEAGKKGAYAPGFDVADCLFFRGYSEDETVMRFLARPKRAQKFVTVFWTVGEAKYSTLVIDAAPVAPPTPPVPPPPVDPPDPVFPSFRAAFAADQAAGKGTAAQAKALAKVFRDDATASARNDAVRTVGDLYTAVAGRATAAVGTPQAVLPATREALAKELDKQLPVLPAVPLDKDLRQRFTDQFARAATLLEALK